MKKMLLGLFFAALVVAAVEIYLRSGVGEKNELPAPECIESLNTRNSSARSVLCPSIRKGITTSSSLFYEKKGSMFFTTLLLGQAELVVGLDDEEYWFWMRSFDPKSIYFSRRERLDFTNLRLVMRPEIIEMMSWIVELDPSSPTFRSERGHVAIMPSGPFEIVVEFDSEKILHQSAYLFGEPIVTLEGLEFSRFKNLILPTKIIATWHEEKISYKFLIDKWIVNAAKPEISLPKGLKRVNLEDCFSYAVISEPSSCALIPGGRSE